MKRMRRSDEIKEKALAMHATGLPYEKVAAKFKLPKSTVRNWVHKQRKTESTPSPATPAKRSSAYPDSLKEKCVLAAREGLSMLQVATKFNVPKGTCGNWITADRKTVKVTPKTEGIKTMYSDEIKAQVVSRVRQGGVVTQIADELGIPHGTAATWVVKDRKMHANAYKKGKNYEQSAYWKKRTSKTEELAPLREASLALVRKGATVQEAAKQTGAEARLVGLWAAQEGIHASPKPNYATKHKIATSQILGENEKLKKIVIDMMLEKLMSQLATM